MRSTWAVRGAARCLLAFCGLTAAACLVDFPHPLGPVSAAFIEPRLLGTWDCPGVGEEKAARLTFVDFDGSQYYVSAVAEGEEPSQARAYATRIRGATVLNLQPIGTERQDQGWALLEYRLSAEDHLALRTVNPEPFEKVANSPRKVRRLLEENLENPAFLVEGLSCRREPVEPACATSD
jgi:hypothetical protein